MEVPFVVGKPVTGKHFIDRKEELKQITTLLSSSGALNNIILLARRRTGKSSILYNLKEQNPKTIYVLFDAYNISTKERFAKAYVNSILDTYAEKTSDEPYKKKLKKVLVEGMDKLQGRISDVDVALSEFARFRVTFREPTIDPDELLEGALKFAEVLAVEKGICLVVMIDEFQELLKWKDDFLKIFRKVMQSQQHVSYILSGSAPTAMYELIDKAKSPLYRQLIPIRLKKLPKKDATAFIKERFASVEMRVNDDVSEHLFELSHGYADYIQRLGLQVFLLCLDQKLVAKSDVDRAYEEMLVRLDADFGSTLSQHSELEQEILITLAAGKTSISAISREIRRPQSTLPKTMCRLMSSDVVEKYYGAKYRIADGVFSEWIYRRTSLRGAQGFRMSLL